MNFIQLNDKRIVNIRKVAYIKYVSLDKSEVLWDRIDMTGGIDYVLIDNQHITEKYETAEDAKNAFDDLEYEGFIRMENVDVLVNQRFIKDVRLDRANETKLDYMLFNGMIQDIFGNIEETEEGLDYAIKVLLGEAEPPVPSKKALIGIEVVTPPDKTEYLVGERFTSVGMVVKAMYADGNEKFIDDFEVIDGMSLSLGQTSVTIKHTEHKIEKTTTQAINVIENDGDDEH